VKGGRRHLLSWAPKKELISITGQPLSDLHSCLITREQANSEGDNKKINNKNCDKARTCVELGWNRRQKFFVTNITNKKPSARASLQRNGKEKL
jgi:hypothetical protein